MNILLTDLVLCVSSSSSRSSHCPQFCNLSCLEADVCFWDMDTGVIGCCILMGLKIRTKSSVIGSMIFKFVLKSCVTGLMIHKFYIKSSVIQS